MSSLSKISFRKILDLQKVEFIEKYAFINILIKLDVLIMCSVRGFKDNYVLNLDLYF